MRQVRSIVLLGLMLAVWVVIGLEMSPASAQVIAPPTTSSNAFTTFVRADRLGITFINSADIHASNTRYRLALDLGAGWNRYPVYWQQIETAPNTFDWSRYDTLVIADTQNQIRADAILLGIPDFWREGDVPKGLNEPIFADGNDFPKDGTVAINPNNPWANFVYQVVQRYKPNGVLAQEQGWQFGQGVRVWEIWNEPDLPQFWSGGINAYARLLKTAYIVAKYADPEAQIMFGGLLYNSEDNWLARTLGIFVDDPFAAANNYYFDMVAVHSYSYPWRSGWLTLYARETLSAYDITKPIWLNESGVSVWNDYPGPTWAKTATERQNLATADQQAWYFVQSSVYAWSEGAEVVFFHQLYDDCGDQPAGTNFPPHNGELCFTNDICWGNAFGIYRNEANSICFSQSPQAGKPRPIANAYRLLAQVFGTETFESAGKVTVSEDKSFYSVQFNRPNTQERITVVWNRLFEPITAVIPAEGTNAQLYALYGNSSTVPDGNGNYNINLSPAQEDAYPFLEADDQSGIGGAPVILIEKPKQGIGAPPDAVVTSAPSANSVVPIVPTAGAIPPARPTTDPSQDTEAPIPFITGLPITSPSLFTVFWGATDNGQVVKYLVWVRIEGGQWQPWLETSQTQADYSGEIGKRYDFAVWAQDAAGNWSTNTDLVPMASTQVQS